MADIVDLQRAIGFLACPQCRVEHFGVACATAERAIVGLVCLACAAEIRVEYGIVKPPP